MQVGEYCFKKKRTLRQIRLRLTQKHEIREEYRTPTKLLIISRTRTHKQNQAEIDTTWNSGVVVVGQKIYNIWFLLRKRTLKREKSKPRLTQNVKFGSNNTEHLPLPVVAITEKSTLEQTKKVGWDWHNNVKWLLRKNEHLKNKKSRLRLTQKREIRE